MTKLSDTADCFDHVTMQWSCDPVLTAWLGCASPTVAGHNINLHVDLIRPIRSE